MGKTFSTGLLTNGVWQDSSNNIGIGAAPSGTYKFQVTGASASNSIYAIGDGSSGGALKLKQYSSSAANEDGYSTISTLNTGVFYFTSAGTSPNFKNFSLNPSGLTDNTLRTYALPNADGTLALTTDLGAYLPLTGGTLTGALGGTSASFSSTVTAVGYSKFWNGTTGLLIGAYSGGSGYGALYSTGVTPSTTNFALATNGASTVVSGTNDASLVTNNAGGIYVNSAGNVIINTSTSYGSSNLTLVARTNPTTASSSNIQLSIGEASSNTGYSFKVGYINVGGGYVGSIQSIAGGAAAPTLINSDGGNVGIGTSGPTSTLEVYGSSQASPNTSNAILKLNTATTNALVFGTLSGSPFACYIQSGGSNTYPLSLNPNGGNVGIGTSSPDGRLTIKQANSLDYRALLVIDSATPNWIGLAHTGSAGVISVLYDGAGSFTPMVFKTSDTERMRITSGGNVGIGGTPLTKLDIRGTSASADATLQIVGNGISGLLLGQNSRGGVIRGQGGSNELSFWTGGSGDTGAGSSGTEYMRITSGGNVLIGTTTDGGAKLQVYNGRVLLNNGYSYQFYNTSGTAVDTLQMFTDGNVYLDAKDSTGGNLIFRTSNSVTERMRITSGGSVFINTTTSNITGNMKLTVKQTLGEGAAEVWTAWAGDQGTAAFWVIKYDNVNTTSQVFQRFAINNGAAACGQINANGASQVAFGSYSDVRLKENIKELEPQLNNILALKPCQFDYKDGSGNQIGFIAQEIQQVYPDVVNKGIDGMLTLSGWNKTEARLVKAIQEQQKQIEELKLKIK